MPIPLHGQAKAAAEGLKLRKAYVAELWGPQAEVTEAEGEVGIVGVKLTKQPASRPVRGKELDHRREIFAPVPVLKRPLPCPLLKKLRSLALGE